MKISLNAAAADGLAVAHMILRHHKIAQRVEILCKVIVPLYEFGDSVDDLHHRLGLSLRSPAAAMDFSSAAGVKIEIGTHCNHPTTS